MHKYLNPDIDVEQILSPKDTRFWGDSIHHFCFITEKFSQLVGRNLVRMNNNQLNHIEQEIWNNPDKYK